MYRKLCALLMILVLLLALPAQAAPVRDRAASTLTEADYSALCTYLNRTLPAALDLTAGDGKTIGVYVHDDYAEDEYYVAECDLYAVRGSVLSAEEADTDDLRWVISAKAYLKKTAGSDWQLVSCERGNIFHGQTWYTTENSYYGFSVSLPDIFQETAPGSLIYTCERDGNTVAELRFSLLQTGRNALSAYARELLRQTDKTTRIIIREEISLLTAEQDGLYLIACNAENQMYVLTLTYDPEYRDEFTLYAEFMRNSFSIDDQTFG